MIQLEAWRWIPGYVGRYQVSSLGRVRSFVRGHAVIMRQVINPTSGYPSVSLYEGGGGRKRKQMMVHWLVMRAFVGPTPEGQEIRHLDGDSGNPRRSNLCFGTKLVNEADKRRHGTHMKGEAVNGAVLTAREVAMIKKALLGKSSVKALARDYSVHEQTIWAIKYGRAWREVEAA